MDVASEETNFRPVSTTIKDDFFDDPFFKDWWKDFDVPQKTHSNVFQNQISDAPRRTLIDSFFDLKSGKKSGYATSSTSSHGSNVTQSDNLLIIEVDIQDFDSEDIDVKVENNFLILHGEREFQHGNTFSKRQFNQRYEIPSGAIIEKISSKFKTNGKLLIQVPKIDNKKSDKVIKTVKKSTKTLEDGSIEFYEEESIQETTEELVTETTSKSTTTKTGSHLPMKDTLVPELTPIFGKQDSETGKVLFQNNASSFVNATPNTEKTYPNAVAIPIDIVIDGGNDSKLVSKPPKSPKSRQIPFSFECMFPTLPPIYPMLTTPSMPSITPPSGMHEFDRLHLNIQQQLQQMQEATIQSVSGLSQVASSSLDVGRRIGTHEAIRSVHEQMRKSAASEAIFSSAEQVSDLLNQDFFVPLRNIEAVQKNALDEASAMAKMKDNHFELVVNIKKFTPEEVNVFIDGQSVVVKATHQTPQGFITDSYEQKFNLPEDVDTSRLTSGISRDGILMIQVPRKCLERIIPIQYDSKISAIQTALRQTFQYSETEMSTEGASKQLIKENIVPVEISDENDVAKAASAEVVEVMTIGVAEKAGGEAGEEAGTIAGSEQAFKSVAEIVEQTLFDNISTIGSDIAGECGATASINAALETCKNVAKQLVYELGAEAGREVGRIAGLQAASIAAAEELAKMNVADISEEKAAGLNTLFHDIGKKVGSEAGRMAGIAAVNNIDVSNAIAEAIEAGKSSAVKAAMMVKLEMDQLKKEAEEIGRNAGGISGKTAGETTGEKIATKDAIQFTQDAAVQVTQSILGPSGKQLGLDIGLQIGQEVASKLGRELGGKLGAEAGQIAGAEAGVESAILETNKQKTLDNNKKVKNMIEKSAKLAGTEAGTKAGNDAASKIDIGIIIKESVDAAKSAAEAKASDIRNNEIMLTEIAEESGKEAGSHTGKTAGEISGIEVALNSSVEIATKEAEKCGKAIFGEEGAKLGKLAGEKAAKVAAENLGKKLGGELGLSAGIMAGKMDGKDAGIQELEKQDIIHLSSVQIPDLKKSFSKIGGEAGKMAGEIAGREAGLKINIPLVVSEAIKAAVNAAEQAAAFAKSIGEEEQSKNLESLFVGDAKLAGELAGVAALKDIIERCVEDEFGSQITKICEEEGFKEGTALFGDFGGKIGKEAALLNGKKAAINKANELAENILEQVGKKYGGEAGTKAGVEELAKHNIKGLSSNEISDMRELLSKVGSAAGNKVGLDCFNAVVSQIDREPIINTAKEIAIEAANKYAKKAKDFFKMAEKISKEAGAKAGAIEGLRIGEEVGELAGGDAGERVGRKGGAKAGKDIFGIEGEKIGSETGAKTGRKYGLKVGKSAGGNAGQLHGKREGTIEGAKAGIKEAERVFKIGISKEKVMSLKAQFAEIGSIAGKKAGSDIANVEGAKAGKEAGEKFAYEEGAKAGAADARKLKVEHTKQLSEDGASIGEKTGGIAGEKAGIDAGEIAGADEAARLGGDEGERIGREMAGDEGAEIGRKIGEEVARIAGAKLGRKIGKTYGASVGKKAGKEAGRKAGEDAANRISKEKVAVLRELFAKIAAEAASNAATKVARTEAVRAVMQVAIQVAAKAAREKLLQMASKREITLSSSWKPTALIAVIANRTDLSDMDKIKLAAKAKMEGNLKELLPKKFTDRYHHKVGDDALSGKLKFEAEDSSTLETSENVDPEKKWKTVVFSQLPEDKKKKEKLDPSKDNVSTLTRRFETKNMKNDEAYVVM